MKRYLIDTHVWLRMPSTKHGRLFRTSATAFSCRPPVPGRSRSTTASASSRRPSHRPLTCPIECAAAARRRCQLTTHTLRTAGVRLAVATSKAEPTARRILRHFGIEQHFEVIAGASTDGSRGSKVDVLAHALAQLRPLPERLVMVGDRSHDVDGAAAHGIDTVVVGWGYGRADFIDKTSTTVVTHAATIDELREALGV